MGRQGGEWPLRELGQRRRRRQQQRQLRQAVGAVFEPVERRTMLAASLVLDGLGATGGSEFSYPFIELGDRMVFTGQGYGADGDRSIWSTDGTTAGTYEIHPVVDGPAPPLRMGDHVYYFGGGKLYRTDGTPAGTEVVSPVGLFVWGAWMSASGDTLYFPADDGVHGTELWKTDGTAAGTEMVADLTPGTAFDGINWAVGSDGALFFRKSDTIYHTDGTAAGTHAVKVQNAPIGSLGYNAEEVDGTLFFLHVEPGTTGAELWKSDGTVAGTQLVKEIQAGASGGWPMWLTEVGETLYFTAEGPGIGRELYKSDGTAAGTQLVADLSPGSFAPQDLTDVNGTLYFTVAGALYRSNGTAGGTAPVQASGGGGASVSASALQVHNGQLYFLSDGRIWTVSGPSAAATQVYTGDPGIYPFALHMGFAGPTMLYVANDGEHGYELWRTDGTPAGTQLAVDLTLRYDQYQIPQMFPMTASRTGGIFVRTDAHGAEPWFTDGTPGGTGLLKDINATSSGYTPEEVLTIGGVTYFTVTTYDPTTDQTLTHLWRTDGTSANTSIVQTFVNTAVSEFTEVGGTLYFFAGDAQHGPALWRSDGTAAGTVMVKDVVPGDAYVALLHLSAVGSALYFVAEDGAGGYELWTSDGTEAGTVRVTALVPLPGSAQPDPLQALGNLAIFNTYDEATGARRLYRTDGTVAGTFALVNVDLYEVPGVAAADGNLYFIGLTGADQHELWKTDGSVAGTQRLAQLGPHGADTNIRWLAALNDTLYFMRDDGALWTSDGTEAGTSQVVDVLDDGGYWHVVAGGAIFFVGTTAAYGSELWKTDGTAGGTVLVRDIGADGYGVPAADLAAIGNSVYFIAYDEAHGYELWKSDGTEDGTGLVKDIWPGPLGSVLSIRGAGGGQVVFHAIDSTADSYGALWFSDGTEAGTHALALGGATEDSNPYAFTQLAGYTYFFASDGVSGQNLFRTDGTTAGTVKLTSFDVEPTWGSYGGLTLYNSAVYFFDGPKMWKVDDAAPQGATLVTELGDPGSATPSGMIEFNGKLFFAHQDILHGQELWVSDGTAGGTHLFLDINPDQYASSSPQDFVVHNGALYFVAYTDTDGWEIYRTDGAAGATVRLTEFTGPNWLFPRYLTSAGGTLYFVFRDSESVGSELWKTDGTVGGSTRIIDPDANSQFNDISELTVMGGRLYFLADNDAHGTELWTSDGTTAGTHLVVDLRHGPATADIRELRAIDNDSALAFTARDGVYGREVWVSDGTALGTVLVDDVAPGAISSYPHGLVEGDGVLAFFAADDADGGRGIWSAPLPNGVFASPDADWFFDGPQDAQTLHVLGGTVAIAPNIEARHANLTIDVAGTGHVVLRGIQHLAGLNIGGGGRVSLPRGGETTLDLLDLDVDFNAGAKLDIADNDIVVRNADAHAVAAMIAASYHFGAWDLPGVMTSMPQAASDVGLTTVAVAAADATAYVFGIPFGAGGVSVDSGDVLIKYTYAGDVNLDGVIDGADYGTLDYWIQFPGTAGFWNGDVNYDGVIDGADYGTLDNSIQLQGAPL